MSEIETSAEAVERTATVLRMNGHHDKAAFLRALAAERDALAALVAKAERMAEALERIADMDVIYPPHDPGSYSPPKGRDGPCRKAARTALAAWRAAKDTPDAR